MKRKLLFLFGFAVLLIGFIGILSSGTSYSILGQWRSTNGTTLTFMENRLYSIRKNGDEIFGCYKIGEGQLLTSPPILGMLQPIERPSLIFTLSYNRDQLTSNIDGVQRVYTRMYTRDELPADEVTLFGTRANRRCL